MDLDVLVGSADFVGRQGALSSNEALLHFIGSSDLRVDNAGTGQGQISKLRGGTMPPSAWILNHSAPVGR